MEHLKMGLGKYRDGAAFTRTRPATRVRVHAESIQGQQIHSDNRKDATGHSGKI